MRDFSHDTSALALNTATLGHNLEGHGAGWPPERIIDACARRGFGGIVFWRREIGERSREIGERVRAAGMAVAGLCRTPFLVGPDAGSDDEVRASIDMVAALEARVLTVVTGGTEPGSKRLRLTSIMSGGTACSTVRSPAPDVTGSSDSTCATGLRTRGTCCLIGA